MIVKFKKLSADAVTPAKAHPSDAGYDLTAVSREFIPARGRALIDTGIAIDIPYGCAGLVVGRSGNTIKRGLVGQLGVIDPGYHNAIGIMAFNETDLPVIVEKGERVGQILLVPCLDVELVDGECFNTEDRGGGFGSSGR